ncbi:MAG: membrane dipeptidase [Chloroflexi bacterium]|nr:membrane dipeptidase [Chloroflexota bacterium]
MLSQRARDLHFSSIVVDCHADSIERVVDKGEDIGQATGKGHLDLPRMREGNLVAEFFACFVHPDYIPERRCLRRVVDMADAVKQLCARYPQEIEPARTAADVRRIADAGKRAAILCIEGGHAIENSLAVLRTYHELGVRYMTLTWNNNNDWADGSMDPPRHHGLSEFGKAVVREMNRLGMLVDVSHVSEETFWDAVKTSTKPVIASHSCAWELCQHPRNLKDEQLKAVAEMGGVVCVTFAPGFVSPVFNEARVELEEHFRWQQQYLEADLIGQPEKLALAKKELQARQEEQIHREMPAVALTEVVDHIAHVARVAGVDHVGLGSDYDGTLVVPQGLEDCSKLPAITEGLLRRGFSDGDVRKVLGENVLRLMAEAIGQ